MKLEGNVDGIKILLALYLKDMEVRTLLPIFMFTLFVFSHSTFYVVFFVVYDNEEHARFWGFSSLGFGLLTAGLGARLWRFQSMHTANSQELTTLTVNGDPSTDVSATQSAYEMENMAVKGYEVARLPDQALSLSPVWTRTFRTRHIVLFQWHCESRSRSVFHVRTRMHMLIYHVWLFETATVYQV